jgi:Glycosyl transferase family 2
VTDCAVIVPVLDRPDRVGPLIRSLAASHVRHHATAYFVVSDDDDLQLAALRRSNAHHFIVRTHTTTGDYARKINEGVRLTEEPWCFLGADDLRFEKGWLEVALGLADKFGKRVVGTNDLGNSAVLAGNHSTHSLVARSYVEEYGTIDEIGKVLHEGYEHQYVDNEFVETAKHRGEFIHAEHAVVEHLHPDWGKAEVDDTYRLGRSKTRHDKDLFRRRRKLWRGGHRLVGRRR